MKIAKKPFLKAVVYIFSFVAILFALLVLMGFIHVTPPWKVTDPDDPKFDPMKFNFYDYNTGDTSLYAESCSIVKKIITIGMPLDTVEHILVESGNAYKLMDDEFKKSYLNPIEVGWYHPLAMYSAGYRAMVFVVEFDQTHSVEQADCLIAWGPHARGIYHSARKRGKYKGAEIHGRN